MSTNQLDLLKDILLGADPGVAEEITHGVQVNEGVWVCLQKSADGQDGSLAALQKLTAELLRQIKNRDLVVARVDVNNRTFSKSYKLPTSEEEVDRIFLGMKRCLMNELDIPLASD